MQLRFSRCADYGLRAAIVIAGAAAGERVTAREIAAAVDCPRSVLAQSLALLVGAGLLAGRAGRNGGYRLARPAAEISIHDLVVAIDGHRHRERCVLRGGACVRKSPCPFHAHLALAQDGFLDALRAATLDDVLTGARPPA